MQKKPVTWELLRKSFAASLLIALGNAALLKLGQPIGPVLFAFGLLGVCVMGLNLFTGKCGFLFQDHLPPLDLLWMLAGNLAAGYLCGLALAAADPAMAEAAAAKVAGWSVSLPFFLQSCLCGVIMYIAVLLYRKGTPLGILLGVPLFIFCGFQHCIANAITLGAARTFHGSLPLCVAGNFAGSILAWFLGGERAKA